MANYLKLKPFHHHRAEDDAYVLGEIFLNLLERLQTDHGVERVDQINGALAGGDPKKLRPYHMIILVKTRPASKTCTGSSPPATWSTSTAPPAPPRAY